MNRANPTPTSIRRCALLIVTVLLAAAIGAAIPAQATAGAQQPAQTPTASLSISTTPIRPGGPETRLIMSFTNPATAPATGVEWTLAWDDTYLAYDDTIVAPGDTYDPPGRFVVFTEVAPGETRTAYSLLFAKPGAPNTSVRFTGTYKYQTAAGSVTGTLTPVTLQIVP